MSKYAYHSYLLTGLLLLFSTVLFTQPPVGRWLTDADTLPAFEYTGPLPFSAKLKTGEPAAIHPDPYFLLGNYRLTLFAHAGGHYQVLSGDRAWGRLNQGDAINSGSNGARLTIDGEDYELVGYPPPAGNSVPARLVAGTGYIHYQYEPGEDVHCERILATPPSARVNEGYSAFLLRIVLRNEGDATRKLRYREYIRANYEMAYQQRSPKKVDYRTGIEEYGKQQLLLATFEAVPRTRFLWTDADQPAEYDGFPPALFLQAPAALEDGKIQMARGQDEEGFPTLALEADINLEAGAERVLDLIIGYTFTPEPELIAEQCRAMRSMAGRNGRPFREQWKAQLPDFPGEEDTALRRELIWHAYTLEAMATYSAYFDETFIPQGTAYDYHWGIRVCYRDHAQLALSLCYYNPQLARSVLRYVAKKIFANGEIKNDELGYGVCTSRMFVQSDNQLYFLYLLAEYLRITGDTAVLADKTPYYPVGLSREASMLDKAILVFRYLRDEIGRGPHGLIRMLNSDWNDDIHFVLAPAPYNRMWELAESHVNTGMAINVLRELSAQLSGRMGDATDNVSLEAFRAGIDEYRAELLEAFLQDWGDRPFPLRYYFTGERLEVGNRYVWLQPVAYALQIPEVSPEKKQRALRHVNSRLLEGEALGPRVRQDMEQGHYAPGGEGENGGFWYVPNSQFILGVATVDRQQAWDLYHRMSLRNQAEEYPGFWPGYWTSSDTVASSISDAEGMIKGLPFCALPHGYLLYLYYRLKAME